MLKSLRGENIMEISSSVNNNYTNKINIPRNNEQVAVPSQGQKYNTKIEENKAREIPAENQAKTEEENKNNTIIKQSNKSKVELYLATEVKDSPIEDSTAQVIQLLHDVQKRDNTLKAHVTYQANQNTPVNNIAKGLV